MILFINTCVRSDSRTRRLAERVISKLTSEGVGDGSAVAEQVVEVRTGEMVFPKVDEAFLIKRDQMKADGVFDDPVFDIARQFASADKIVIAAPYWDLSFPASLKQYIEQINLNGVTFEYTPEGQLHGLCKASELVYVTTAGGDFCPDEFGFGYIKALAQNYYGIPVVRKVQACGLDLVGADPEAILESVEIE